MFVPPYDALLGAIGLSREVLANQLEVTIPTPFLRLLLEIALDHGDFNERGYLSMNPDVAQAIQQGAVRSARDHYVTYGYWEGRRGATPQVSEAWYKKNYPDVAAAIKCGLLTSAAEHYQVRGVDEFRVPNNSSKDECLRWKIAVTREN